MKPFLAAAHLAALSFTATSALAADPLPSWNEGPVKQSITAFVGKVTKEGSPDFVPPAERIATFDNDGCLWCEQPMYVQAFFVFDSIKRMASQHPEWKDQEPFASVLKGDMKAALAGGEKALVGMLMATHSGMTTEEFEKSVTDWLDTAKHPKTGKLFTEMVYQPMLELLAYLRANGFKTFIVSGGGIEFMRPWTEKVYGIPPEQVVGSSGGLKYELRDGTPVIEKVPGLVHNDDKEGKPVGIQRHIGRRPIMAFGNSDGDFQMLEWTTSGQGPRFGLIVHHDDAEREWAYDRESHVGRLDKGLDEGPKRGWVIVSMKEDWATVYATGQAFDEKLELQGVTFRVQSVSSGGESEVVLTPSGLTEVNEPIRASIRGAITGAEVSDMNADGSPEVFVYVRPPGGEARGAFHAWSANRNKSLSEIYLPELAAEDAAMEGHEGKDEYAVVEGSFIRRFRIGGGKTRQLQYKLHAGEAGWVLKLDRKVEY